MTTPPASTDLAVLLTVEEAARRLNIGRTTMYALVSSGAVESVTIGRLRRVPGQVRGRAPVGQPTQYCRSIRRS
jgi:excisionase family DNA binding protein